MKIFDSTTMPFSSKLHPVKPYTLRTKLGKIYFSEAKSNDYKRPTFVYNLARLFCRNYASMTYDPSWLQFKDMKDLRESAFFNDFKDALYRKLNSNDSSLTLLLARDRSGNIQGACLSYGLDNVPKAKDSVCYIDAIAVNKLYRQSGIGANLVNTSLKNGKLANYTDAFLAGDKKAAGFYKKIGFQELSADDDNEKTIINYIANQRFDYPKYVNLYTKAIQEDKKRWFIESAKAINQENLL